MGFVSSFNCEYVGEKYFSSGSGPVHLSAVVVLGLHVLTFTPDEAALYTLQCTVQNHETFVYILMNNFVFGRWMSQSWWVVAASVCVRARGGYNVCAFVYVLMYKCMHTVKNMEGEKEREGE